MEPGRQGTKVRDFASAGLFAGDVSRESLRRGCTGIFEFREDGAAEVHHNRLFADSRTEAENPCVAGLGPVIDDGQFEDLIAD